MSDFIIFLQPGRDGMVESPTDDEAAKVEEHFAYLKRLTDEGVVVVAGRTTEPPFEGIVVIRTADRAAARSVMNDDPALKAGVFTGRFSAFRLALMPGKA